MAENETDPTFYAEGQNAERPIVEADVISEGVLVSLQDVLADLRSARPNERSERSRRYTVTITEIEKIVSYFKIMVVDQIFEEER